MIDAENVSYSGCFNSTIYFGAVKYKKGSDSGLTAYSWIGAFILNLFSAFGLGQGISEIKVGNLKKYKIIRLSNAEFDHWVSNFHEYVYEKDKNSKIKIINSVIRLKLGGLGRERPQNNKKKEIKQITDNIVNTNEEYNIKKIELTNNNKNKDKDWENIGKMEIFERGTENKTAVFIEKRKEDAFDGKEFYRAWIEDSKTRNKKILGSLNLYKIELKQGKLYSSKLGRMVSENDNCLAKYGSTTEKVTKIWVESIEAMRNNEYRGIGTGLMQFAIERSFSLGYQGRVSLGAVGKSHEFYVKMGLRAPSEEKHKELEEKIKKNERCGIVIMHLPEKVIEERWKKQIKSKPVLLEIN